MQMLQSATLALESARGSVDGFATLWTAQLCPSMLMLPARGCWSQVPKCTAVCFGTRTLHSTWIHCGWKAESLEPLQAVAESQFGSFLEKQGATLVGEDVNGVSYEFKFRFWTNNQSRMYLIEGCSDLLKKYKLSFGDVIVFARKDDGTLVLGGRPAGPVWHCAAPSLMLLVFLCDGSNGMHAQRFQTCFALVASCPVFAPSPQ